MRNPSESSLEASSFSINLLWNLNWNLFRIVSGGPSVTQVPLDPQKSVESFVFQCFGCHGADKPWKANDFIDFFGYYSTKTLKNKWLYWLFWPKIKKNIEKQMTLLTFRSPGTLGAGRRGWAPRVPGGLKVNKVICFSMFSMPWNRKTLKN